MKRDIPLLFRQLTHGVYVIGVSQEQGNNAFTAAWVMQVSYRPLLLAVAINPQHSSFDMLVKNGYFSVNVLSADDVKLAEHFGRAADTDKLADCIWHTGKTKTPILDDAMAYFECIYSHKCDAGDHVLVVGRVIAGEVVHPGADPLNYRDTGDIDGSRLMYPENF